MHGDIARPWSVDELGRAAGMSRSAPAERSSRLIGMAPMHYLAHWRMQTAAQKLRNTSASLAQVAQLVGYEATRRRFRARSRKPSEFAGDVAARRPVGDLASSRLRREARPCFSHASGPAEGGTL